MINVFSSIIDVIVKSFTVTLFAPIKTQVYVRNVRHFLDIADTVTLEIVANLGSTATADKVAVGCRLTAVHLTVITMNMTVIVIKIKAAVLVMNVRGIEIA